MKPYADPASVWRCPWCVWLVEAPSIADRWDHAIDAHLQELKVARPEVLAGIVRP